MGVFKIVGLGVLMMRMLLLSRVYRTFSASTPPPGQQKPFSITRLEALLWVDNWASLFSPLLDLRGSYFTSMYRLASGFYSRPNSVPNTIESLAGVPNLETRKTRVESVNVRSQDKLATT